MPLWEQDITLENAVKGAARKEYHDQLKRARSYDPQPAERRVFDNSVTEDDDPRAVLGLPPKVDR